MRSLLLLPVQLVSACALFAIRLTCSHPPGAAATVGIVGGFGEPIWIRRCRCGAEVRL